MNMTKLTNIILILSLLLFLPLFRPPTTVDLVPFRIEQVIINLQGRNVVVSSDTTQPIGMNVSYMDPVNNKLEQIVQIFFNEEHEFELSEDKKGNFLFEFTSTTLSTVVIDQQGIPQTTFVILGAILLIRFLLYVKDIYTVSLDY